MSTSNIAVNSPRWQWTLLDLLVWTAYAGAFFATIVFFGLDSNPFLAFFLFFSLLMTASLGFSNARAAPVIGISALFGLVFFSIPLIANCAMHAGLVGWEKLRNRSVPKKIAVHVSLFCLFFSIGGVAVFGLGPYRNLMELRKRTPVQNQAQRLRYEDRATRSLKTSEAPAQPRLTDRWKDFELTLLTDLGTWPQARNHYLRQIHDRKVESFVKSQGFGVSRMGLFHSPDGGVLPPLEDVPFRLASNNHPQTFDEGNFWITPQWRPNDHPIDFHFAGLLDFLNSTTYGLMIKRHVTIGFEPHAFHFSAEPVRYENATLLLANLQLVSLRRFDEPRIYVLDHLPRMDQLSQIDLQTRSLDEFETDALKKIQDRNEDVIFESGEHTLSMLGSIRAVQSCLDCHTARRGELLGAFSYRFEPIPENEQK